MIFVCACDDFVVILCATKIFVRVRALPYFVVRCCILLCVVVLLCGVRWRRRRRGLPELRWLTGAGRPRRAEPR